MTSLLTILEPTTRSIPPKTILSQEGFTGALIRLAPGEATPPIDPAPPSEQLLFVVEGEATVRRDLVNTVLEKDQALLIPQGRSYTITATGETEAKILRFETPQRQDPFPALVTIDPQTGV